MAANEPVQTDLDQILGAIKAIHDPKTTNEVRGSATSYLENAKKLPNAPELGFNLAVDSSKDALLRHYGLQMLEYYIKYTWDGGAEVEQILRDYVLRLAQATQNGDPPFVRNKVAQLWTEVAKRSWGLYWNEMDAQLHSLWDTSPSGSTIVLGVLETLSDEVIDSTAIRGEELADYCSEIFSSASVLPERVQVRRDGAPLLRHGQDGWLSCLCMLMQEFFNKPYGEQTPVIIDIAQRAVRTIRSMMYWITPAAVLTTNTAAYLYHGLHYDDEEIRTASVDSVNTLLHRTHVDDEHMIKIVTSLFSLENVATLQRVLTWAVDIDATDIDPNKYAYLLKLGEVTARLGGWLETISELGQQIDAAAITSFVSQMWLLTSHPSLMTSRSIMTVWIHFLRSPTIADSGVLSPYIPQLLQHCTSRLVRFEAFSSDRGSSEEEPLLLFLDEDYDTLPEKHAFLGNYRRFCFDVIELIVQKFPLEAVEHILGHSRLELERLSKEIPTDSAAFSKHRPAVIMIESQLAVVDAAAKGSCKWANGKREQEDPNVPRIRQSMRDLFRQWCEAAFALKLNDPEVLRRFVPVAVNISTKVLNKQSDFAVFIARELLANTNLKDDSSQPEYSDAVRTAQHACTIELQRLALSFADAFLTIYNELEQTIQQNIAAGKVEIRPQLGYQAFLLIIVQRATNLDPNERLQKMQQILEPVKSGWLNPEVANAAESFQSFCTYLGFAPLPDYLLSHRFAAIEDWSQPQLDQEGKNLQNNMAGRSDQLPIRLTRAMLAATTEKSEQGSPSFEAARTVWSELMPVILPNILKFVSQAQGFYDPENWSGFPPDLQLTMKRVFADRFWQAGISAESRDDFFNKVNNKSSYDGLASTIRGSPRQVRETCYSVLDSFSKFRELFYSIPDLPSPLAEALFGNAHCLSPHHYNVLLRHAEGLISKCPEALRDQFLPPLLAHLYRQTNVKLSEEWATAINRREEAGAADDLGDEMKLESILRQVTSFACGLTAGLLDQAKPAQIAPPMNANGSASTAQPPTPDQPSAKFSTFVLSHPEILHPILVFMKSALSFRDTRSVGAIIRTLRSTIPLFKSPESDVHTFICTEILQAAILSLHNPYFIDCQRDLAILIAQIIQLDAMKLEEGPVLKLEEGTVLNGQQSIHSRNSIGGFPLTKPLVLALPGMQSNKSRVDAIFTKIGDPATSDKQARAWVLELLKSVRGVSIHELGKMSRPGVDSRIAGLKERRRAMAMAQEMDEGVAIKRGGSPTLDGIAGMFGE